MDFLELAQALRRDCMLPGSGPTSVLNQTGQHERLVYFIRDEYTLLQQEEPNWKWLRGNFTLQTTANVGRYAYDAGGMTDADSGVAIARWAFWWTEEFQIFLTSSGIGSQAPIPHRRWESWRQTYLQGSVSASTPAEMSIDPQDRLRLGPAPNGIYTVTGEYQKGPQILAADGDVPEIPPRFHDLIVARAMKRYAAVAPAPEIWTEAERRISIFEPLLRVSQLPEPRLGKALC